jgi:virginiamycin B lyase
VFSQGVTRPAKTTIALCAAAIACAFGASQAAADKPGQFSFFPVDGNAGRWMAAGPGGVLWFTEDAPRVNKAGKSSTVHGLGRASTAGGMSHFLWPDEEVRSPAGVTAGPDGNMWFSLEETFPRPPDPTSSTRFAIGRVTPAGALTTFPAPQVYEMTKGPDGALWFVNPDVIGRISMAGSVTNEYPLPDRSTRPNSIALGPDGNLWYAAVTGQDFGSHSNNPGVGSIGRVTPAGVITEFPVPSPGSYPNSIVAGSDGNLWFAEPWAGGKIGKVTPDGQITEIPARGVGFSLAAGPDGNLWFGSLGVINRMTPSGHLTQFPIPLLPSGENATTGDLVAGSDGNIWFSSNTYIGRIVPGAPGIEIEGAGGRRNSIRLHLTCSGSSEACSGTATIRYRNVFRKGRVLPPKKRRTFVLLRALYEVPAESTKTVALKLAPKAKKRFGRDRTLRGTASLTVSGGPDTEDYVSLRRPPR